MEACGRLEYGTLQKILLPHLLTFEEFATVVTEIEAILNSRPLLTKHSHPQNGSSIITAGHFPIGRPLKAHQDHSSKISHWLTERGGSLSVILFKAFGGAGEHSISSFCKNFSKWRATRPNLQVGDVVVERHNIGQTLLAIGSCDLSLAWI